MKSAEHRWFNAYEAYKRANNPQWKAYWLSIMNHFRKEFN